MSSLSLADARRRDPAEAADRRPRAAGPQIGERLPPFDLADGEGGRLRSQLVLRSGPAVLVMLPALHRIDREILLCQIDRGLRPLLDGAGIGLAVVASGDIAPLLRSKRRLGLSLALAADPEALLGGPGPDGAMRILIVEPDLRVSHAATGGPGEIGRARRRILSRLIDWAA